MKIDSIDCWIEVDGKKLDEYGVEVSEGGKACAAWIPSEVGQKFAVCCQDTNRRRESTGYVQADGKDCGGKVLRSSRTADMWTMNGVAMSTTTVRHFQFGALALTDDDSYLTKNQQNVGEIKVELWRCHVGGATLAGIPAIGEPMKMHERSKKGVAHAVQFGEEKRMATPLTFVEITKVGVAPFATFTFRYRGIDMLRANGIAPPAETAVPHHSRSASSTSHAGRPARGRKRKASEALTPDREDVKPEIIDMDEVEDVEDRVRQAENELRRARLAMHRKRGNKKIKLEDVLPIVPGEVLDLTELDSD
ncbi:hypothetical protein BD626DRAFT_455995 [Schizophyllum amplum]|uniref:DUF7918 domain-containing protein n=1 Tax=Schizophyllum amplum TaxID=97359 RepID=A0A550CIJ5_9AGAR|nr:hypothetical protein BD626DRAFT_455995 [Auriculariopsis ampla]